MGAEIGATVGLKMVTNAATKARMGAPTRSQPGGEGKESMVDVAEPGKTPFQDHMAVIMARPKSIAVLFTVPAMVMRSVLGAASCLALSKTWSPNAGFDVRNIVSP